METHTADFVLEFIRAEAGNQEIVRETPLDSLGLDSLELLDLLLACEVRFRGKISDEMQDRIYTAGDLADAFA